MAVSLNLGRKKSHLADETMGEGDFGFDWLIRGWGVFVPPTYNICYISGNIDDEEQIVGIIDDEQDINGKIGCWS